MTLPPFGLLVEQHGSELLAHARRLSGSDGEDVLQDALLKALRSYGSLSHGDGLRAWLYRVVTTTAYDHSAKKRPVPVETLPESGVHAAFYDDAFEVLLDGLPGSARDALELRFVEDLDYEQIARRLDISSDAARQRVSTAVRNLRRRMA